MCASNRRRSLSVGCLANRLDCLDAERLDDGLELNVSPGVDF
jgi:hypothetical protein